jgi:hypothetical protein
MWWAIGVELTEEKKLFSEECKQAAQFVDFVLHFQLNSFKVE